MNLLSRDNYESIFDILDIENTLFIYIYKYTYKLCEHVHVDNAGTKEKMFARYQNM